MTIAITVRTGSAVVFAADSKVTTSGIVGIQEDGKPRWMEQTYDNAVKVVHDSSKTLMAMVAGEANIGQETAMDFIMAKNCDGLKFTTDQDAKIKELVESMVEKKKEFWQTQQMEPKDWPGPTLLLTAASSQNNSPRVWRVDLSGEGAEQEEIMTTPTIWLEGSYNEVFGLLYGYEPTVLRGVAEQLGANREKLTEAMQKLRVLRPIDKLSL